jgi:plastocyanin
MHMKKVFLFTAAFAAIVLLGAGCAAPAITNNQQPNSNLPATPTSAKADVSINNFSFSPVSVAINKGMTVVWTNNDSIGHTIAADSGNGPGSGVVNPGETYAFTFNTPGIFSYHCSIHPSMKATVVVNQ